MKSVRGAIAAALCVAFGVMVGCDPPRNDQVVDPFPPAGGPHFARGMVSITFDDGWESDATVAAPMLSQRGMKGTFYLVPGWFGTKKDGEPFVTLDEAKSIVALGHEIGDHTFDHPKLPGLEEPQIFNQIDLGRRELSLKLGIPEGSIVSFASPYGAWDDRVLDDCDDLGMSHRSVSPHVNTPIDDPENLGGFMLGVDTIDERHHTPSEIAEYIARTASEKQWMVLVFHGIQKGDIQRATDEPVEDFVNVLDEIQAADLDVVTVREGVNILRSQTGVTP